MMLRRSCLLAFAGLALVMTLAGCPQRPELIVSPQAVAFPERAGTVSFMIRNAGGGELAWSLTEVVRADSDSPWEAAEVPWLTASPGSGQVAASANAHVDLTADPSSLAAGLYNNVGVRVSSNGGETVVPVSLQLPQTLVVSPQTLALSATATSGRFSITNLGTGDVSWQILFLRDPAAPDMPSALPEDLDVSPDVGQTGPGQTTEVQVSWGPDRDEDFYLLVRSDAGDRVVGFRFGAALEGLVVRPIPLTLYVDDTEVEEGEPAVEQAASILRIGNASAVARSWQITLSSLTGEGTAIPISVAPSSGTTAAGQESEVSVVATDGQSILNGGGNYSLVVRQQDTGLETGRFVVVPIIVEVMPLPEIAISYAPQPDNSRPEVQPMETLDFGRESIQEEFWIANIGPLDSNLYFRITHEDQGVEDPIIADISPSEGGANGSDADFYLPGENVLIDGVPITVTINRSNLEEDVEFRTITVQAVDEDGENTLDAVEAKELKLRVERQPLTVEGATNRSRPPYVMRFVFLLRDAFGDVIPTQTAEERERINFTVSEDGVLLDLDETSKYVDGPENLKVNLVVMLDYTGSMYSAGTMDTTDPLDPGEALENVKQATKKFLDDLPPGYRVALMFHNDRQQQDRLIHSFTTDRASLKAALDEFTIPVAQFGVSDIRDALVDAIDRLAAEDANETLPFDDADVRAVVFITDGRDNSSVATLNDVTGAAADNRVRLYPLGYSAGARPNNADLLVMAKESGGHLFSAGNVRNLTTLLGNEYNLELQESPITGTNAAYFKLVNIGGSTINWSLDWEETVAWIDNASPAQGTLLGGDTATVTVRLDPAQAPASSIVQAPVTLTSNDGTGKAVIRMEVGPANTADSIEVTLEDDPGRVWNELRNQIVLTYITPLQEGAQYNIRVEWEQDDGDVITGSFEEDGVFFPGDVRAGQLALTTGGIVTEVNNPDPMDATRAEVFLRTDYVPRNVTRFRLRFYLEPTATTGPVAEAALEQNAQMNVELAPQGLLVSDDPFASTWRLLRGEDGVYDLLTAQENTIPYGASGNLLKITITGLEPFVNAFTEDFEQPEFLLTMRADNQIYVSPASGEQPSDTKFFLYPGGQTNIGRSLLVGDGGSDLAPPARDALLLADPGINPEAANAWDLDEDGLPDFNDTVIDDPDFPPNIVAPDAIEIGPEVSEIMIEIRNNRLDTFTWWLDMNFDPDAEESLMGAITIDAPLEGVPLPPGTFANATVTVDKALLDDGVYDSDNLVLNTDLFGFEVIPMAVVVQRPAR